MYEAEFLEQKKQGVQALLCVLTGVLVCKEQILAVGQAEFPSACTTSRPDDLHELHCLPQESIIVNEQGPAGLPRHKGLLGHPLDCSSDQLDSCHWTVT